LANKNPADVYVREVMTRDLVIAQLTDSVRDSLQKMRKMHFRHLPVVEEERLVALISLRDLMAMEAEQKDEAIQMLNYYVGYSPE
jgi:CBS domain-containing protein